MPIKLVIHYDNNPYKDLSIGYIRYNEKVYHWDANNQIELDLNNNSSFAVIAHPSSRKFGRLKPCVIYVSEFTLVSKEESDKKFDISLSTLINNNTVIIDSNNWIVSGNKSGTSRKMLTIFEQVAIKLLTKFREIQNLANGMQKELRRTIALWIYPREYRHHYPTLPK